MQYFNHLWYSLPLFLHCSCCSVAQLCLFATPWTTACQASPSFTISWGLFKFMSSESVMLSHHLILTNPSSFAFSLSQHQVLFQWVGSLHHVAKVLSFSISPSNEYSGLISFIRTLFFCCYILVCLEQCFTHSRHFRSVCWLFEWINEWMHVMNTQKKEVMHWTYMKETALGFGADACKL